MKIFSSRTLILLLSATVLFAGCSKSGTSDSSDNYYIKGKKNGADFSYTNYAMATIFEIIADHTSLSLSANNSSNAGDLTGMVLGINFSNGGSLAPGTYIEDGGGVIYAVSGVRNPNSTTIVYGAGGIHVPTARPLKIVITSITDTEITGTFEGAFYKQDLSIPEYYDEYLDFTEGEFRLPL